MTAWASTNKFKINPQTQRSHSSHPALAGLSHMLAPGGRCANTSFQLFIWQIKPPCSRSACLRKPDEELLAEGCSCIDAWRFTGTEPCTPQPKCSWRKAGTKPCPQVPICPETLWMCLGRASITRRSPTCPLYFLAPVIKLGSHLFSPAVPGRQKVRKTKPRGSITPALPPLTHSGSSERPRNAFLNVLRSTPSVPPSRLMAHLGLRAQSGGLWSRHGFAARLHPVEGVLACGGDPPRVPQTGGLNNRHLLSQF